MAKVSLHQEWISLLEISGPFLSQKILREAFPQGLHGLDDSSQRARLRENYAQFSRIEASQTQESQTKASQNQRSHADWIKWVLSELLNSPDDSDLLRQGEQIPEKLRKPPAGQSEWQAPDFVFCNPTDFPAGQASLPRLLVQIYPLEQALHKPLSESLSGQSPIDRMSDLCRQTGVPLGLISNGEDWIAIHAPLGETSTTIQWQAALWIDENITWRAFLNLLGYERLLGDESLVLEALFKRSQEDAFELTDQLGVQVREAVEILVHTLDRLDAGQEQSLLRALPEAEIYEAALTVMMRLVLLFCAEERGLLPMNNPLYRENYALSTLGAELREAADQKSEDVLQYLTDAWGRLLATFRLVYAGADHDLLQVPAYGGSLFDPDRFAFLEGRRPGSDWRETPAEPLAVDNRTVLHLLESLQIVDFKAEGEKRRVSFRALDPEQIGYIYEGLLDHTAVRAQEPLLGLKGSKGKKQDHEPELPLSQLEAALEEGEERLIALLQGESKRSASALAKDLHWQPEDTQKLKIACYNDEALLARVLPFAGLLREDAFGLPFVVNTGGVVVTQGVARASSGTHYTPRFLCEEVVQHTLEPLVYSGPAEGLPPEQWQLKPPEALLALRICDLAMGSGAFLVQSCRYLADKLMQAWNLRARDWLKAEMEQLWQAQQMALERGELAVFAPTLTPPPQTLPYGTPSLGDPRESLLPSDPQWRLNHARRLVALHCLYGVDKNPMAVEMAKLSLWLITLAQDMPFGFLNHHLRCGDSLLGLSEIAQLQCFHLQPEPSKAEQWQSLQGLIRQKLTALIDLRAELVKSDLPEWEKELLQAEAEREQAEMKLYADLLVGACLKEKKGKALDTSLLTLAHQIHQVGQTPERSREQDLDRLAQQAAALLGHEPASGEPRRPFHWVLEFPEIFVDPSQLEGETGLSGPLFEAEAPAPAKLGFDALVGNPPFLGGQKLTGTFGTDYREFMVAYLGQGARGSADLCAYFFLRASNLLKPQGNFGLVATNTLAQGDTREVGLDQLCAQGSIFRAVPTQKWMGTANLEVALVWWNKGTWRGAYVLQGKPVAGITPYLAEPSQNAQVSGNPFRLATNANQSFQGSIILGLGFTMSPEDAQSWIAKNPKNKDVLFPYLNGQDLNSHPEQQPSRWAINFFDWPLDRASAPAGYSGPVAADYPEMLEIVEQLVKPERVQNNRKARRDNWWKYAEQAKGLYEAIADMRSMLVTARVSSHHFFQIMTFNIFADRLVVIPFFELKYFALLSSEIHNLWAHREGSTTHETRQTYFPVDAFETFPFPPCLLPGAEANLAHLALREKLETIGEAYYTHRQGIMARSQLGLTKTYNRFHDPGESHPEIAELRRLHVAMDEAVAHAYGWGDLALGHGFHETKQGLRFTVSEAARQELLDRLLALNHARYAEEVAQGLHSKKKKS
ncbi:MAG: DNA methyltransferase [Candidatus Sericytochromatia bacterium]